MRRKYRVSDFVEMLSPRDLAERYAGGKYDIEVFQSKVVVQEYVESIGLAALFVQPGVSSILSFRFLDCSALTSSSPRSGTSTTCSITRPSTYSRMELFRLLGSEHRKFCLLDSNRTLLTASSPLRRAEDKTTPMIYLEADFGRAVALLVQNYTDSQKFKVVRIYERSFSANEVVEAITRVSLSVLSSSQ